MLPQFLDDNISHLSYPFVISRQRRFATEYCSPHGRVRGSRICGTTAEEVRSNSTFVEALVGSSDTAFADTGKQEGNRDDEPSERTERADQPHSEADQGHYEPSISFHPVFSDIRSHEHCGCQYDRNACADHHPP
jgi:hypothetical protein